MSDELQAAIAELKRVTGGIWRTGDIDIAATWPNVEAAIVSILNSVASGALIPAPAVPDDVAAVVADLRDTAHNVRFSRRAAEIIEAQSAELARLKEENGLMAASLDEEERKHGLSTNGGMWRFWSQQLREYHERRAKERAALTHPTGEPT